RLTRNSSGGPITTVDSTGNLIDLVKDQLPELQLSEEDRQKNLELLEQAKKVSDRFLTRRGRRSTGSRLSPTSTPSPSPSPTPCSSRNSSVTAAPQSGKLLHSLLGPHSHNSSPPQCNRLLVDWKPIEKRKVSSGTLTPRYAVQKENYDPAVPRSPPAVSKGDDGAGPARNLNQAPATGVAKPVPRPPTQQAPCTAEIKTIGAFPPLMRAVSWDSVGSINSRNGAPSFPPSSDDTFSEKPRDNVFKSSGYKDLPSQLGSVQKLSKLKEEHKLMRNQSIVGSKLPDLSEAAEQEKGPLLSINKASSEETREKSDAMPNISDNAFVQLSLAFRNDNYTLEMRLKQAERERNLTEEDTEKELEEFKCALKVSSIVHFCFHLYVYISQLSGLILTGFVVQQEKRMSKATEVMMQYVENLKRTYEKDHAELMEFKKLANQNSNRYDGVPRPSRSMSLTLGKALPRRRVSVAVVPKFNLLNIPGQSPTTASPSSGPNTGPAPGGYSAVMQLCARLDCSFPSKTAKPSVNLEEIRAEIKAKIEEEAYNKG
uniref:Uncharacterized protein n=1 Tax=Mola mola TaxID=94237 RepID=A0A3Q4BNX2_MOLML